MPIIHHLIFLWFFLATNLFSVIVEVHVITLKDDRQIVLLGDVHDQGSYQENVKQAYWAYELISRFQKQNRDRLIILLFESLIYAPEGLTKGDVQRLLSLRTKESLYPERGYVGKKIGSSFILRETDRPPKFPTWITLNRSTMLPILYKYSQIPNVSIIPCNPRLWFSTSGMSLEPGIGLFDLYGFVPVFTERYWHEAWKKDLPERFHDYFNKHFTNIPKALISTAVQGISDVLDIREEDVFSIVMNSVSPMKWSELGKIRKMLSEFHSYDPQVNSFNSNNPLQINSIFDSELVFQILRNENQNNKKTFFAFIGCDHSKIIIRTLKNLDLIKAINFADFRLSRDGLKPKIFIKAPIKFAAVRFGVDLDNNNDVSEIILDMISWLDLSAKVSFDNNALKNIENRMKNLYRNNDAPRDEKGYSLLSYLINFLKYAHGRQTTWRISDINKLIEIALAAGADPNTIDPDGGIPIVRAIENICFECLDPSRHISLLELLLKYGANPNNPKARILLKMAQGKLTGHSHLNDIFFNEGDHQERNSLKRKNDSNKDDRPQKKIKN